MGVVFLPAQRWIYPDVRHLFLSLDPLGLPSFLPCFFRLSKPKRILSLIIPLSNSAMAPKTWRKTYLQINIYCINHFKSEMYLGDIE